MKIAAWLIALAPFVVAQDKKPEGEGQPADAPQIETNVETLKHAGKSVELTADYYLPIGRVPGPMVVCCHMAKSSRGEFQRIAPEFVRWGCSVLAVDLSSGKERNGVVNETAAAFKAKNGKDATYAEAYDDVVSAVAWARELRPDAKVVLLGSSYSATLALAYAAREPAGVDAVLAFSPGEYIEGWTVAAEMRNIKVPVHISCGSGLEEKSKAMRFFNAADKKLRSSYYPTDELALPHGAEMLWSDDPGVRQRTWSAVQKLINALSSTEPAK